MAFLPISVLLVAIMVELLASTDPLFMYRELSEDLNATVQLYATNAVPERDLKQFLYYSPVGYPVDMLWNED